MQLPLCFHTLKAESQFSNVKPNTLRYGVSMRVCVCACVCKGTYIHMALFLFPPPVSNQPNVLGREKTTFSLELAGLTALAFASQLLPYLSLLLSLSPLSTALAGQLSNYVNKLLLCCMANASRAE